MSRLNSTNLSQDRKTVTLGTGNRWGEVYSGLEEYGLAAVGGRSGDVGVGGLILGGESFLCIPLPRPVLTRTSWNPLFLLQVRLCL